MDFIDYKSKYMKYKNLIGSSGSKNKKIYFLFNLKKEDEEIVKIYKAINILKENYDKIIEIMFNQKKEISGIIDNHLKIKINEKQSSEIMAEPEKAKCFACWHSHPPLSVLTGPEDDIVFTPPSTSDLYYTILGCILSKYNHSFVVSKEGIYRISPFETAIEKSKAELTELLSTDDPWRLPAEAITNERGLIGFNFYGKEENYPFISKLLNLNISWDKNTLDEAVTAYIETVKKMYIDIEFINSTKFCQ